MSKAAVDQFTRTTALGKYKKYMILKYPQEFLITYDIVRFHRFYFYLLILFFRISFLWHTSELCRVSFQDLQVLKNIVYIRYMYAYMYYKLIYF